MHTNCHARSKQKRKKLRLKNRLARVWLKRLEKIQKEKREKGTTVVGIPAAQVARHVNTLAPKNYDGFYGAGKLFDHAHKLRLNQRQKRKRARQAGTKLKRK